MRPSSPRELASYIDHTLLKADASARQVEILCAEALQAGFAAVCVNGCRVALARKCVAGSGVKVASVVGFPLGAMVSAVKARETEVAVGEGADEIDMVLAVGALKDGDGDRVRADIAAVVQAAGTAKVKVILECCLLSREEKILACQFATDAGAAMVKTSTGFGGTGASVEDVQLLRAMVPLRMGVKAAGGIRDTRTALALIEAGATRLGTSSGVALIRGVLAATEETY